MAKVFISHSTQDRDFTLKLAENLSQAGIPTWLDHWEIKVGDSIVEKINEGIRTSDYLIVVLSKASTTSRWVREELSAAKTIEIDKKGVFILPVLLETCDIPPMIAAKRYADFRLSFTQGLDELLDVFGRTHVRTSDANRYRALEGEWSHKIEELEEHLSRILRLIPSENKKEYLLTEDFSEVNRNRALDQIRDILDLYRALRPLEKSETLSWYIDGTAYFLAILAKAHDIQLRVLSNRYPSLEGVDLGVYLLIGSTQATCDMFDESIWTFRKAIRIALAIKQPWEDALFALTYQLSRFICFFNAAPEQDLAIDLLVCYDRSYLKSRCERIIRCYRSALEKEVHWRLNVNADDRISYFFLMASVGFWGEAAAYLEKVEADFPESQELKEQAKEIRQAIKAINSPGKQTIPNIALHQMPPFFSQLGGTRQRLDDIIEERQPSFWKEVVLGLNQEISAELIRRLFPAE